MNALKRTNIKKITEDKILFFDMDGTLIDTDYANFLAYQKSINLIFQLKYNIKFNPNKRLNRENLREILPNLTEEKYFEIVKTKENYFIEYLVHTELKKDMINVLLKYSRINKTVLVTNSQKSRALILLEYFGLLEQFDEIFCQDSLSKNKKINKFKNAIQKLGIKPNRVIAFENDELEILLALKAGIEIINPVIGGCNANI